MLPVVFLVLSVAFGASASSCSSSVKGIEVDRKSLEGKWWIQVQYGAPPVTDSRCYTQTLSLNSDGRLNNVASWKVGSKTTTEGTPEIPPPEGSSTSSGEYYFLLKDGSGIETAWFVQVDYKEYMAVYGCENGETAVFLIATRNLERNKTRINEIAESVAKVVTLPEGKHWTDITDC
ncbi:unnamed protein product [Callosobruchus maculatus]|uniref:Lipocalin/cytosolic fatty-acid binding domain-containing protein n=1 Tax=Callosobruchus maculatus TaxID=64391 RepID=A0A653D6Z3_CALMS|nr:unnamed protein product [Callosobruchus maculatus]